MIAVNTAIPITLHLLEIPLSPASLSSAHGVLAVVVLIISLVTWRQKSGVLQKGPVPGLLIATALLFALLTLPLTHIAGIDTYKWQDLASNVAIEQRISWLIHPLSLLGFTPRSYSSAQPLVLATIQMLGHTGIDWGFYILSLSFGLTGLAGALALGRSLFKSETSASWLAILYVLSPVFMRYNYWATGRGLLLALLPLYLLILVEVGRSLIPQDRNQKNQFEQKPQGTQRKLIWLIPAWLFMTVLLMMSHKAGVIGALLIPILFIVSPALRFLYGRWGLWIAVLVALSLGLLLAGGQPVTLATRLVTRFGWLLPLALFAIGSTPARFFTPPLRALFTAGLGTLVLSCTPDMYGALLALPFMVCVATIGLEQIKWRPAIILGVTAIPAVVIVINQMRDSPSPAVYQAAQFIEQHDPRGPFRIEAPGPARHQIQAYVSGCPRFTTQTDPSAPLAIQPPPPFIGQLVPDARRWTHYLRTLFSLRGAETDWYGTGTKVYYITVDGQGLTPQKAKLLFTSGNVAVFE